MVLMYEGTVTIYVVLLLANIIAGVCSIIEDDDFIVRWTFFALIIANIAIPGCIFCFGTETVDLEKEYRDGYIEKETNLIEVDSYDPENLTVYKDTETGKTYMVIETEV